MLDAFNGSACELLARAQAAARYLGHARVSTGHLLVAFLQSDLRGADLLHREGFALDQAIAAAADLDDELPPTDATGDDIVPLPTRGLLDVAQIAHEHAVLFESESLNADHLLLGIVTSGKCSAAETLDRSGERVRQRLDAALVERLAPVELGSRPRPTTTGRESVAIAWSRALALGADKIDVEDLLYGLSAPRWTIGARALAALGRPLHWSAAMWSGEAPADRYRPIPFGLAAREALDSAYEEAVSLGQSYVGTEHLVLGVARTSLDSLSAFVGRDVAPDAVRDAVAGAVASADAAREAESRRRGWDPSRPTEPSLLERVIDTARRMEQETDGRVEDPESTPRCWPALLAAILDNRDEGMAEVVSWLRVNPDKVRTLGRDQPDVPFDDAIRLAEEHSIDHELEHVDLITAVAETGSPRVVAALDRLGLTAPEVIAQLTEWRLGRDGDKTVNTSVAAVTSLNVLISVATSVALIESVSSEGAWWKLVFLPLVWSGHPGYGPVASAVVAGLLAYAISPLVGALHLVGVAVDFLQARTERQSIWARTGVKLSLRELRCVTRRALGASGRRNQYVRQILRAELLRRVATWARSRGVTSSG